MLALCSQASLPGGGAGDLPGGEPRCTRRLGNGFALCPAPNPSESAVTRRCVHRKPPYETDLLRGTLRARDRPRAGRTVEWFGFGGGPARPSALSPGACACSRWPLGRVGGCSCVAARGGGRVQPLALYTQPLRVGDRPCVARGRGVGTGVGRGGLPRAALERLGPPARGLSLSRKKNPSAGIAWRLRGDGVGTKSRARGGPRKRTHCGGPGARPGLGPSIGERPRSCGAREGERERFVWQLCGNKTG